MSGGLFCVFVKGVEYLCRRFWLVVVCWVIWCVMMVVVMVCLICFCVGMCRGGLLFFVWRLLEVC